MKRTQTDRRGAARHHINFEAWWEGVLTRRAGTVVDISTTGCFILTGDDVQPKELIRLEMTLPSGELVCLWGEVVYAVSEMGFALRFTGTDEDEQAALASLLNCLGEGVESGGGAAALALS